MGGRTNTQTHKHRRISLHLRNGSISATAYVKSGSAVRCAVTIGTFCALCTDTGIVFYEGKDRRLLSHYCMQSTPLDEGVPGTPPPSPGGLRLRRAAARLKLPCLRGD
jgi:hypothetical protein